MRKREVKKAAVIGFGSIALRHRKNLKELYPDIILYGMSSSGRALIEEAFCDTIVDHYNEIIDAKVEFVIVASPATYHSLHALPFINSGIPVLIEKPICAKVSEVEELHQATLETSNCVAVAYCLRYLTSSTVLKRLLSNNDLGKVYSVMINTGQYLPSWRPEKDYKTSVSASAKLGGGVLLELSHELDYAAWLFGKLNLKFSELRNTHTLDIDVEEVADLYFHANGSIPVYMHLDFLQKSPQRKCTILTSEGRLEWDLISDSLFFYKSSGIECLYENKAFNSNQMYLDMIKDFLNKINGNPSSCVSVTEAKETLHLIESIRGF